MENFIFCAVSFHEGIRWDLIILGPWICILFKFWVLQKKDTINKKLFRNIYRLYVNKIIKYNH